MLACVSVISETASLAGIVIPYDIFIHEHSVPLTCMHMLVLTVCVTVD